MVNGSPEEFAADAIAADFGAGFFVAGADDCAEAGLVGVCAFMADGANVSAALARQITKPFVHILRVKSRISIASGKFATEYYVWSGSDATCKVARS
jgi:hypothetical protein